ncbi:MAG: shikimate kinase [Cytophagales bacterium]|nr:shikimate kinase [Cytophagales bacterium]
MTPPSRIFLVGLPGSGKSTVGRHLAKELNYSFQDLDLIIEKQIGRSIADIFDREGEEYFRKIEADQLRLLAHDKVIVATGGGTPCFHNSMSWMNDSGLTVFLNPPIDVIVSRIEKESHRPLIGSDVKKSIEYLLEKRIESYNQAEMESGLSEPCEILAELQNFFTGKNQIRN